MVALADSLFFSIKVDAARPRVLLYLLFTMAPFAVVAPVLGPFLDRTRGGRRMLIAIAAAARAVLCVLMAAHIHDFLLYPLTFGALVASKGQSVAKSALVPAVVDDESELVSANSRLALIGVLAGALGAVPATAVLKLLGGAWVLRFGTAIFALGTLAALGIPPAKSVGRAETDADRRTLHAPSIIVAGSAMGLFRGVVGFMTFFAAFVLKRQHEPAWVFGLVIAASALGNGVGVLVAPLLRRKVREEWILAGSLLAHTVDRHSRLQRRWSRRARRAGASLSTACSSETHTKQHEAVHSRGSRRASSSSGSRGECWPWRCRAKGGGDSGFSRRMDRPHGGRAESAARLTGHRDWGRAGPS